MKIEYRNLEIKNIDDWKNAAFTSGKKRKHWKKYRSSYSLADFILNRNGISRLETMLSDALQTKVVLDKAEIEYEVRFDEFGHGREHDLGIWGKTESNQSIFIGLEAKVDEPFGDTVATVYHKAKVNELNGKSTNAPERIENLLKENLNRVTEEDFNLRYQFLYSTVGTISDANINVLLILIFKTEEYNFEKGCDNKKDFYTFMRRINAAYLGEDTYKATIRSRDLIIMYREVSFL